MTDKPLHHRCPECGGRDHLYGRADCRWSYDAQEWVVTDLEDEIDCGSCGWVGSLADTVLTEKELREMEGNDNA